MSERRKRIPSFILLVLSAIVFAGSLSLINRANAQSQNIKQAREKESFTRPDPKKTIKPTIPDANRFQQDKVFLENADSLYRPVNESEEFQIVKGSVKFRQGGMWLFCDSAYYFPQRNSMDAFGHVEMRQGDTLFVYADKVYYDGLSRHAILTHGPSRSNVQLKNRSVTLTTDSLDYDLAGERGWYTLGGTLEDDVNTLTSQYGEYSPATKIADFRYDVVLVNRKDGYKMFTEELRYNTATHIADINTLTRIEGATDTIVTSAGNYNTATDYAVLTSRSLITHRDSAANVTTLEGDSIIYDKATRISRAYMFRDSSKLPAPMVINDTARKVTLIGGYGEYNDSTRSAFSTDYPLLIEYSRPDTLFLRADTVLSFIEKVPVDTVGLETKDFNVARAIGRARFFSQDIQGIADTLLFKEQDSILYMIKKPVVWSGERQVYGNLINVHLNDSTADWAELPESGMLAEHVAENFYNQLTGTYMMAYFSNQALDSLDVKGNVIAKLLPQEQDSSYNKLVHAESSYLHMEMDGKDVKFLKMWPEVTGNVKPLFEVKTADQFIEGFVWLESLRPVRDWYGSRARWLDDLGEVSDEMDEYFKAPPLFKTMPKSARDVLRNKTGAQPVATPQSNE
ncbi:MAG: hypothetical protein K2G67_04505 [Muribaculaceae bacterium]|nr:hypothetical protein [Muribaculaceae bacterium]